MRYPSEIVPRRGSREGVRVGWRLKKHLNLGGGPVVEKNEDCASVWFAILERAKFQHDFRRAAEAQRKLEELGVKVKFTISQKGVSDAK